MALQCGKKAPKGSSDSTPGILERYIYADRRVFVPFDVDELALVESVSSKTGSCSKIGAPTSPNSAGTHYRYGYDCFGPFAKPFGDWNLDEIAFRFGIEEQGCENGFATTRWGARLQIKAAKIPSSIKLVANERKKPIITSEGGSDNRRDEAPNCGRTTATTAGTDEDDPATSRVSFFVIEGWDLIPQARIGATKSSAPALVGMGNASTVSRYYIQLDSKQVEVFNQNGNFEGYRRQSLLPPKGQAVIFLVDASPDNFSSLSLDLSNLPTDDDLGAGNDVDQDEEDEGGMTPACVWEAFLQDASLGGGDPKPEIDCEQLVLSHRGLTRISKILEREYYGGLRTLFLGCNGITDIENISQLPLLRDLHLNDNHIGDLVGVDDHVSNREDKNKSNRKSVGSTPRKGVTARDHDGGDRKNRSRSSSPITRALDERVKSLSPRVRSPRSTSPPPERRRQSPENDESQVKTRFQDGNQQGEYTIAGASKFPCSPRQQQQVSGKLLFPTSLMLLNLKGNRISRVEKGVFRNLCCLEFLGLAHNHIEFKNHDETSHDLIGIVELAETFRQLNGLDLAGNYIETIQNAEALVGIITGDSLDYSWKNQSGGTNQLINSATAAESTGETHQSMSSSIVPETNQPMNPGAEAIGENAGVMSNAMVPIDSHINMFASENISATRNTMSPFLSLKTLCLHDNRGISEVKNLRRKLISRLPYLTFLDKKAVSDVDHMAMSAWRTVMEGIEPSSSTRDNAARRAESNIRHRFGVASLTSSIDFRPLE